MRLKPILAGNEEGETVLIPRISLRRFLLLIPEFLINDLESEKYCKGIMTPHKSLIKTKYQKYKCRFYNRPIQRVTRKNNDLFRYRLFGDVLYKLLEGSYCFPGE